MKKKVTIVVAVQSPGKKKNRGMKNEGLNEQKWQRKRRKKTWIYRMTPQM